MKLLVRPGSRGLERVLLLKAVRVLSFMFLLKVLLIRFERKFIVVVFAAAIEMARVSTDMAASFLCFKTGSISLRPRELPIYTKAEMKTAS